MDHTLLSIYCMNATRFPTLLVRYVSPRRRTHFALFHGRGTAPAAAHTVHAAPECARAVYLLRQGYCVAVVTFALVELTCGVRAPLVLLGRPTTGRSKLVWCGPRASWCGRAWPLEPHHQRLPLLCLVLQQIRSTLYFTLILQRESLQRRGPALTGAQSLVDQLDDGRPRSATAAAQTAPGAAARAPPAVAQRDRTLPLYRARVPCAGRRG